MSNGKNKWENPICNNCKSKKYSILWKNVRNWEFPEKFRIVKCFSCGLVFLSPRPRRLFISNYYAKESYWGTDLGDTNSHLPIDWKKQREEGYRNIYKKIFQEKSHGSILDIGAGTGVFLSKFKEKDWQVSGIEYSKDAATYSKRVFGLDIKSGDFLDYSIKRNTYDVIVLNNSLEHLYSPKETLEKAHFVLKNDGLLVITVPNFNSIGAYLFGKHWFPLQPPIHLFHFTYQSLSSMLRGVGFRVISSDHSFWIHNYYSLFQSFRFLFSPKYKKGSDKRRDVDSSNKNLREKTITKEVGKIVFSILSYCIAVFEPFIKKGEVMIIYARKN